MARYINRLKQFSEASYSCSFKVFDLRTSLMINHSVCFVVVVLSSYQAMRTIRYAMLSSICCEDLLVFKTCSHYLALVTFSVSLRFESETQTTTSVLTSNEAWVQCTRHTAAWSFWNCTKQDMQKISCRLHLVLDTHTIKIKWLLLHYKILFCQTIFVHFLPLNTEQILAAQLLCTGLRTTWQCKRLNSNFCNKKDSASLNLICFLPKMKIYN